MKIQIQLEFIRLNKVLIQLLASGQVQVEIEPINQTLSSPESAKLVELEVLMRPA